MSEMLHNNLPANNGAIPQPEDTGCLDWDAEITCDEPQYLILPEGDYTFRVADVERGRHEGSNRLPPCNKATIHMEIQTPDGMARARTILFLHGLMEWKIFSFFCCIGQVKKGETLKMNWDGVPGAWGRAHFRPRSYEGKDGETREVNEVTRFLDFDPDRMIPGFIDVTGDEDNPF